MKDWYVVSSISGIDPEFGNPIGQFLCRSKEDAEETAEGIYDAIIERYLDLPEDER